MTYRLLAVLLLAAGLNTAFAQDSGDATQTPETPAAATAEMAAPTPEATVEAANTDGGDNNGLQVNIDVSDDSDEAKLSREEVKERIKDKITILLDRALEAKIDGSEEAEKELELAAKELEQEVKQLEEDGDGIEIDLDGLFDGKDSGDFSTMGALVALIPLMGIVFTFGTPIAIVGFLLYAAHRKRRMNHEMINQYLASGKEIPPEVLKNLFKETAAAPKNNLHSGLSLSGIGLGLFACLFFIGGIEVASLGLIPLFIGLARLAIWKLEGGATASKAGAGES